jgi:hypothetical protein
MTATNWNGLAGQPTACRGRNANLPPRGHRVSTNTPPETGLREFDPTTPRRETTARDGPDSAAAIREPIDSPQVEWNRRDSRATGNLGRAG